MQFELGTDHDHRPARIVDTLAKQVLAEPALLALEHVSKRLERTLVGAGNDAATAAVVKQCVDRLLQHPLFVTDDNVRRTQLDQSLEAVIAVDDATVEIVEIRCREAAAVERNQRTQIRRDHRNHGENHQLRLVARLNERLNKLKTLGKLLRLEFGLRLGDLKTQVRRELLKVERFEHLPDRLGAYGGGEAVLPVLLLRPEVFVLRQQLTVLERREARLQHHVVFEIENALEILERHVEQQADPAWQRLQEPYMRNRRRQLDVAHALAPYPRQRHLDAAFFADDSLIFHALVLAAQALVVLDRPEDARAEQSIALGLEGAVVDRLRLLDLAIGPRADALRARDRDADLLEGLRADGLAEKG